MVACHSNKWPPRVGYTGISAPCSVPDFVYKSGGESFRSETHPHPKKILTQNLTEGKSNLNKRPLCGTPPPLVLIPYKQSLPSALPSEMTLQAEPPPRVGPGWPAGRRIGTCYIL